MSASTKRKERQAAREAGTDRKMLARQEEEAKKAQSKRRWTWALIGVAVFVVLVLFLDSGLLYKTTAITVGDEKYNASEMNYQYGEQYFSLVNQYGDYASIFGLDTSAGIKGLAKSQCAFEEGTWKDYFLKSAKAKLQQEKALRDYANANGAVVSEEDAAAIEDSFVGLDDYAKLQGYASADNLFSANYGNGVTTEIVRQASYRSALAAAGLEKLNDSFVYTPEQLAEEYESHNGEHDLFDFVSCYVAAETVETTNENGESVSEPAPGALDKAKATADAVVEAYNKDKSTDVLARMEAAVAAVDPVLSAGEQTMVSGSSLGDYSEWMLDAGRKEGDVTAVAAASGNGYYVVAFISRDNNDYNLANVRHILIKAVADETGAYTEEAKAAALTQAQSVLDEFNAGDKAEESFAALAEQYSEDDGSNANGGLYENIARGQMVPEFDAFCFEGHKPGDTAIVYGDNGSYAGYHVMYYVGEGQNYRDYIAESELRDADLDAWLEAATAALPIVEGFGMRLVG